MPLGYLPRALLGDYVCSFKFNSHWEVQPRPPAPSSPHGSRREGATVGTACPDRKSPLLPTQLPLRVRMAVGRGRSVGECQDQLWPSAHGLHTKILTFLRGATGHSTFPSRVRVMLTLVALSGRKCQPWLVTMCTRQTQPGRG